MNSPSRFPPLRFPPLALLCCLLATLLVGGCGGGTRSTLGVHQQVDLIHGSYAFVDRLSFDLTLTWRPPADAGAEPLSFSLIGVVESDGRVRLHASKMGVPFLEGVIDADGQALLVLDRDQAVVRGNLHEAITSETGAPAAVFTRMPMLVDELRRGPLPYLERSAYSQTAEGAIRCDFADGTAAVITPARDHTVLYKDLLDSAGVHRLRMTYGKHAVFDGALRPRLMIVSQPGQDGQARLRLRAFDALGSIDADRMTVTVPDGYREMPPQQLVEKILD
jgi:hypothetical protein